MTRIFHVGALVVASIASLAIGLIAPDARADTTATQSFTGTLTSPESTFETTITLTGTSNVELQTFGFGGGTNAQGTVIAPGGTDPFLAIFVGTGDGATILMDGSGNAFGTSLDLSNYASFAGCPPAGSVNFVGPTCGDITMALTALAAGTYTIVLSDGEYIANAVFDNGTLGEGFTDLTGGGFCNLVNGSANCPNTAGAFALDIATPAPMTTPEPSMLSLLGSGMMTAAWLARHKRRRQASRMERLGAASR